MPSHNIHPLSDTALSVVSRPIADLKPYVGNPRHHPKHQVRQIAHSIETFGFVIPILIDAEGNVIAGHGRLLAAKLLGMTSVPTVCADHLSPEQARAYRIADNRLNENSKWDDLLLAQELKILSVQELDFDLDVIGYDMGEIDMRIEALDTGSDIKPDPADEIAHLPIGLPVSKPGDLWLAGKNRLLTGSALDLGSYGRLMDGRVAAMVLADPPYNVPIDGHVSGLGAIRHREFAMATGEMDVVQFTAFLRQSFKLMAEHSKPGSLHYIFMDWRHMAEILAAGGNAYSELKNLCVWVKSNGGMGSLYRSRHELVFVFKHGNARHRNNVELGKHGRNRTNVWEYPSINNFGRSGEEGNLLALHPTPKAVKLVADAILDSTARGDIVLDPFLGSGTTLIAAERTGRRCYGMELDPVYVDTAIRRWQEMTGCTARHAVTGLSFNEAAQTLELDDVES